MRNLKKFLALILAFMMTFSLMVTVNASGDFTDSEQINAKFSEAVTVLEGLGVFKGYKDGDDVVFKPTGNITRAEVAAIVYRLATGDAAENQAHLYVDGSKFTDVVPTDWYAGVVGYCANANLILGYGNGKFGPNDNVTGIQALTMILRAVGYGQGGEFQGAGWESNAYSRARNENLLKNVDGTSYAAKLSLPATRELIAEILFQAAQIPTVTWTQALGYNKYSTLLGQDSNLNDSLGEKFFGLASDTGIIVGNEATGEDYTKLSMSAYSVRNDTNTVVYGARVNGVSYEYATDTATTDGTNLTLTYSANTGLDMFGHKATIWYDNRSSNGTETYTDANCQVESEFTKVYAVFDQSTRVDMVYASDGNLASNNELNKAAKASGFSVDTTNGAYVSDAYAQISSKTPSVSATNGSKISNDGVYMLISNSGAKGDKTNALDVVVALNTGMAQVYAKNDYSSPKTVTLLADRDTPSTDSFDFVFDRSLSTSPATQMLLTYGENAVQVGSWVIVNMIYGTSTDAYTTLGVDNDELFGLESITKKVEGKITSISGSGVVTLDNGQEVKPSALWNTTLTANSKRGSNLLRIGATVTLHLDAYGKYVRVTTGGSETLLGAYAYWEQNGIDGVKYYVQGVSTKGEKIVKEIDQTSYYTLFANQQANSIPIHHMRNNATGLGGTNLQIVEPDTGFGYVPYTVRADGAASAAGWKSEAGFSWTKDNKTVNDSENNPYYFSNDTVFYVVSGWGNTLTVDTYNSLSSLVKGADSLMGDAYFFIKADDTEHMGSNNNIVTTVFIVNAQWIQPNSFFYNKDAFTLSNEPMTLDNEAAQLQVYAVGKDTTSGILVTSVVDSTDNKAATINDDGNGNYSLNPSAGLEAHTFYTYVQNSKGYYQLIADKMDGKGYGVKNASLTPAIGGSTNTGTAFGYIAFNDGTNDVRYSAANATVVDVTGVDHGITNYETLRRAVERNTVTVDILLTSMGGTTASVIYVTSVA